MTNLRRSYDEFTIINMLIFERSYDDFMILNYDKVMITVHGPSTRYRIRNLKTRLRDNAG